MRPSAHSDRGKLPDECPVHSRSAGRHDRRVCRRPAADCAYVMWLFFLFHLRKRLKQPKPCVLCNTRRPNIPSLKVDGIGEFSGALAVSALVVSQITIVWSRPSQYRAVGSHVWNGWPRSIRPVSTPPQNPDICKSI